jgi:hypothetical protein
MIPMGKAGVCMVDPATGTASISFVNINSNQVPAISNDRRYFIPCLTPMRH